MRRLLGAALASLASIVLIDLVPELSAEQIETLRKWIEQGAQWDDE
jgi:hypothetical protein